MPPENQEIKDSLHRILSYLENDDKTGRRGIVTEVELLKNDFTGLKNTLITFIADYRQAQAVTKAKIYAYGSIGGVIGTGLIYGIDKAIEFMIKHIHV